MIKEKTNSPLLLLSALTKEFITPDTLLYHGTTGDFNKFDLKAPRNNTTPEDEVNAVFFSTDRFKAWTHAKRRARATGEEPRIITAKVKFKNLYDATDEVKKMQKKLKNFGKAKRLVYNAVDKTKFDGIEFRGDNVNDPEYLCWNPDIIHIQDDKKMEAMVTPKYFTKQQMMEQGAGGHLDRAVKCFVPLEKLDGLEPVPAASENNPYVKGKAITNPIEVKYDKLNDVFIVYAGNHRIQQARINGDKYILAFVEPDGGKLGLKYLKMEASERKTTITKNPTPAQIKRLIKNEPYHEIKGWIDGKDVYFWNNVENWHHADQAVSLGIPENKIHTRANNINKIVIMPIAKGGYNKDAKDFAIVNYGWNDEEDKIKGLRAFMGNAYLRNLIKDLDLYIDDPDNERIGADDHDLINYIKGIDFMKKIMIAADFNELACWITSDGTQIDVTGTDQTHMGTFKRLCNEDSILDARFNTVFSSKSMYNIYEFATRDLGWIRVSGHGKYFSAMVTKDKVSVKAISTLSRLLKNDYDYAEFILDYYDGGDSRNYKEYYRLSDLIGELRKNISKELVASLPSSEYGYWLHDGKIGDIEHQAHDVYVRKHFSDKKLGVEPWSHAFKQGWIRAVNERTGNLAIELWYNFVNRGALKALSELINKRNTYKGFIVEINRGTGNTVLPEHLRKRWFTFKEDEEKKVLHLVRQCLKDDEMTANDEQYGYWFTTTGEQLDVEEMRHNYVARKYIENKKELEDKFNAYKTTDMYSDVYKNFALNELGWIRTTVTDDRLDIEIAPRKVAPDAFKALRKYIDKESTAEEFLIDVIGVNSRFLNRDRKPALYNDIQKQVRKEITASDDEPYGYWIADEGALLKVDFEDHNGIADKYIHRHYYKEYLAWVQENDTMDSTEFLLTKGFIRLVAEGETLNIEIDKAGITGKAYKALSKFYNSTYFDRINVDVGFQRRTTTSKRFSAYEDDLNKLLPFMRTYISKNNMEASASNVGFWINPEGTVLEVGEKDHTTVSSKHFKSNDPTKEAVENKWIRIRKFDNKDGDTTLNIQFAALDLTRKSFNSLAKLIKDSDPVIVFVDRHTGSGYDSKKFEDVNKAIRSIRQNISKNMEAASDFYGAWITDKGEVLEVDQGGDHSAAVMRYKSHSKELSEKFTAKYPKFKTNDVYAFAFDMGWLRIISATPYFRLEFREGNIAPRAASILQKYVKDYEPFVLYILDKSDSNGTVATSGAGKFDKASDMFSIIRSNINKDKTILAIDGENNVTGRYSQIAIEQWQPDNSADQIQLLNIGQDFIIRNVNGTESSDLTPFKFVETARKALLDLVRDMEHAGIIYKKQAVQPIEVYSNNLEAADGETVVKRWETGSGKHAITLVKDQYGYAINNFILLPNGQYKKDGTSYLGKADLEQALAAINKQLDLYKTVDGTGFKEVKVSKVLENLVPKKEAQKTAQVTVRGRVQDQLDGFAKFSKQPDIPGLAVYVKKVGSYHYAKLVHESSRLAILSLTNKPLSFSPSELVERIDLSKLKNYNWSLPQDQLFKKYGPTVLANAAQEFNLSLDMKKMDKTDQALDQGLKGWVKDYIIAVYLKRPDAAKNLMRQIDKEIKDKGLNKEKVYFYYGNPSIKSDETWTKVGLVRIGTSAPYKYEFADKVQYTPPPAPPPSNLSPVQQAIVLINQGYPLDAAVKQIAKTKSELDTLKRDVKLAQQKLSRIKQETGDSITQKEGSYTWAKSRDKKSLYSLMYKGSTIGSILVDDVNLVKTLQSFGNDKTNSQVFDSPYLKNLKLERSANYGINMSYELYSGTNRIGLIYSPTPEIFGIIKRISSVVDKPVIKPAKAPAKPDKQTVVKSGMVGSYITGTDRFGDKVSGMLLTEKKDPKKHKSTGTAVIIDEDGAPVKVKLTGVRRKLVKPPTALTKAYKTMTASLRLEASGKTKEELRALNKSLDSKQGYHSYRLKVGSYCSAEVKRKKQVGFGYSRKFVDHTDIVKGILIKENSYKNNRVASGGLLMDNGKDKDTGEQMFVVNEVVGIKPIFKKAPSHLKTKYNNLVKAGKISGGKEIK